MNRLNICIDIDGTITDPYYWLKAANKYFDKNIKESDITDYHIHKVLEIEKQEYDDFYEKKKFEIHSHQELRKDAISAISLLSKLSNIYFVTARTIELELLTYSYLVNNNIPFDKLIIWGNCHKVDAAINLNCDIFIEDSLENAIELSKVGFKVLLIDTNYNHKTIDDEINNNIIRVNNWKQIYSLIDRLILQEDAM